jgi:hypothetical protein
MIPNHDRSAYRIVCTSCSIVGESSLSDSRIIKLIGSSDCCPIRESVRSPDIPRIYVPDLPGGSVIDLRAVADGHKGLGICQRCEFERNIAVVRPAPSASAVSR